MNSRIPHTLRYMTLLHLKPDNYVFSQKKLNVHLSIYEVFKRIYSAYDTVFFLESLGELGDFSRYSIIGCAPKSHIVGQNTTISIDGKTQNVDNPFFALRNIQQVNIKKDGFVGGLVGYVTYEGTKYFEPSLTFPSCSSETTTSQIHFPDMEFGLYLDGIIYDKKTKDFFYFFLDEDRSDEIMNIISHPVRLQPFSFSYLGPNTTRQAFETMVNTSIEHIKAGDIFQIIMSMQFHYELSGSPLFVYEQLRDINPSPHMYFLKFGTRQLIGASPELVMRYDADHNGSGQSFIENFPLAGTTKRGKTKEEDENLARMLLGNEKERAEHMMLVDLGRNDIGKVCSFGTVQVDKFMTIKRYSHVQHIASEISGIVRKDKDAFDCLAATAPMGTGTGAPKIEAMKIINRLEKAPRGPYSGQVGYISFNGNSMFCIALRSLFIDGSRAYSQSGGGLVYDSNPDYEYREAIRKGAGMRTTLEQAQLVSQRRQKETFSLEELRTYLDRADEKILFVLKTIAEEKRNSEKKHYREEEKRKWVAHLFQSIGAGMTDFSVQEHFASITPTSPEVDALLSGSHFMMTTVNGDNNFKNFYQVNQLDDNLFFTLWHFFSLEDHGLLEALQQRNYWVQYVGYTKKTQSIALRHIERERELIEKMTKRAKDLQLPPDLAQLMYMYVVLPIAFEIQKIILEQG